MDINNLLYTLFWGFIYLILLIVFVILFLSGISAFFRKKREQHERYSLTFLQVKLPQENEIEVKAAEQMFAGLAGIKKTFFKELFTGKNRVSFEIVSKTEGIYFYVIVPDELASLAEKQINGSCPDAEIDVVHPSEVWDRGAYTSVMELKLAGPPYYPIKTYEDLGVDTLSAITSTMSKLGENEAIALQVVIEPSGGGWRNQGHRFLGGVRARQADPQKNVNIDPEFLEGVEKKIGKVGFDVAIRLVSLAENKVNADAHLQNVVSAFEQFTNANYNRFKKKTFTSSKKLIDDFIYRRLHVRDISIPLLHISLYKDVSVLNTEELATVFHFPNKNVQTPKIVWLGARRSAAPLNLPKEGDMYLGDSIVRGVGTKVFQKREDRRRHTYIIGQTGTGKSVQLMHMAQQDILKGEGLCVIDPHGSDIDGLLEMIP